VNKPQSDYDQIEADEWVPWIKDVDLACCDCGLVHRVKWRIVKTTGGRNELQLRFSRNGPATGGIRKALRAAKKK